MTIMRVEISIAKNKTMARPKDSIDALTQELTKRLSTYNEDVEVIVKTASKDGFSILRLRKRRQKTYVQEVPQEALESADNWFTR